MQDNQFAILQDLAAIANGRTDHIIELAEFAPSIDVVAFMTGLRFVDRDNPRYRGGSQLVYFMNTFLDHDLIEIKHLTHSRGPGGGLIKKDPGIIITAAGFDLIENQPVPDYLQSWNIWFRSKPLSAAVMAAFICIPMLVAIHQIILALMKNSE